ncbi:MAG: glutamate synthase, partial [Anaerolineae bacterium]|nr:glutamate synthase [Anaerolineae bacterium]
RPDISEPGSGAPVQLDTPLLLGGLGALGDLELHREIAATHGSTTLEDLATHFAGRLTILSMATRGDESIEQAVLRLQSEAVKAVTNGTECLLLDDTVAALGDGLWIDPLLLTAAIDRELRKANATPNLRRRVGIVVRSGSLRDLHDIALCVSLGANALLPYAIYAVALGIAPKGSRVQLEDEHILNILNRTMSTLTKGLQKVTSTIGCHELRGYGHSFSSIGLSKSVAAIFGTPNYFGSDGRGLTWTALLDDAEKRRAEVRGELRARLENPDRFFPKMWKKAESVAQGEMEWEEYTQEVETLEKKIPVSIRHLIGIQKAEEHKQIPPEKVDISVGNHDLPLLISAMSFGSQGELAYRTYAEAAKLLNIICMNGEGGELPDMMGKYKKWRGQQIASARFGVNIGFLNSADFLEIKIGQGAKPGEGGHLPGHKVTEQVAESRHTTPGVD